MKILGIESAGITASCAISEDDKLLCEYLLNHKKTHSEKLMPLIIKALEDREIKLSDIDVIAISKGPGSYTGLRIGAAVAKGLAQAISLSRVNEDMPIVAVPTMQALAANIFDNSRYIVPIIDAKAGRIYSGVYKWENSSLITIKEQFPADIEEIIEIIKNLDAEVVLNGDGSVNYREILEKELINKIIFAPEKYNILSASSVNLIAHQMAKENKLIHYNDFSPEYLRLSQAERLT
jgi:tRNA threonylcarbamoyladenosine biosynthesis protein TsaB